MIGNPSISLLWEATFQNGLPHTLFLAPPVTACIPFVPKLSTHNKPTAVICYTCTGPMPTVKITLHVTNVKLTIGITTSIKYFHLTADYWSCIMFFFFFVRYDPYGCEDLCVYRYSADHLFVRASCAMSNVSAMKTGVHWGKWYSFWAMPCNSTLMYCTCTINRQCAWVSFEATAEVYNEVNHASSNENANHLEYSSTAKVGCWRRYVTLHFFCFEWYVFSCAFSKILTTPSVESKDSC